MIVAHARTRGRFMVGCHTIEHTVWTRREGFGVRALVVHEPTSNDARSVTPWYLVS